MSGAALKIVPAGLKRKLKRIPFIVGARLTLRGLAHTGFRYRCNCCGWKLRAFVESGQFFGASKNGYCPRCDAKARHRRLWLFLNKRGLLSGSRLRLNGSRFQGISQASGGNTQDSSSNYPLVQLRSIGNEQVRFLSVDPSRGWSDTTYSSLSPTGFVAGPALVTVFTNGIPSGAKYLVVPP